MIRDYMVSVWTLQDSFITVLKPSSAEMRGKDWIQNPEMSLKDDAMNTFSFSIPMYIDKGVENPNWHNVINGTIIEALRKVKVIFHPHADNEKVFEFIITKVTERHETEQCFCDVECEDAIFHELGKIGYKLSLTPEDFELDHELWEKGELKDKNGTLITEEPVATIQYWNDKIFGERKDWSYSVEMDYSYQNVREGFTNGLAANKIYEDPYVASWQVDNGKLVATKTEYEKEKARTTFSITESNIYNATQEIAEAFGVFCRYEYTHDSQYYITGRRVIYYNNYIKEKGEVIEDDGQGNVTVKNPLIDITYPYETKAISREMDGTDIITKMYVQQIDDELTDAGTVTITDVEANKTKEDYLMNFDYLYKVGGLNETQYAAIKEFEVQVRELNEQIQGYQALLAQRETTKTELEAKIKGYDDRIVAANKQIDDMNQYIANLNNSDDDTDPTTVLIDPSTGGGIVLVQNSTQPAKKLLKNRTKAIVLPSEHSKGITSSTLLEVYETYSGGNLSNLIKGTKKKFNNEGALQEVYNIPDKYAGSPYNGRLYVKYKYRPGLYYERVRNLYTRELTKVTEWREKKQNTLRKLNNRITNTTNALNTALAQKEKLLLNFEKMMGSALREGYWNPENYTDYGNSYTGQVTVDVQSAQYIPSTTVSVSDTSGLLDFNWYNAFKDNGIKETNTSTNYKYSKNTTGSQHGYLAGSGTTVDNFLESYTRSDVFEEGQQIAYYNLFGFVWDEIENKPKIHYNVNTKCFYPYVKLSKLALYRLRKFLVEDGGTLTDLVFRFYDSTLDGGNDAPPGIGFAVGSEAIFAFVEGVPTESNTDKLCLFPVFILTGTESCSFDTIGDRSLGLNGYLYSTAGGTRTMYLSYWDADNQQYEDIWEVNLNATGVQENETFIVCNKSQKYAVWYPCITIDSLKVKKSGDESGLTITLNDQALSEFEDFSMIPYIHTSIDDNDDIVTDNKEYVIIKSDTLLKYGLKETTGASENAHFNLTFKINYTISNADTAIYLDAIQVLKENSIPKVSYNVDLSVVNTTLLDKAYDLLGVIGNINDTTLKFENIQGYVSEVDLKLDMPWEDSIVLKNYKNKFEDLFSKIVAETSAMQKNAYTVGFAAAALATSGGLKEEALQETINNADLNYAFNNGTLTIDEVNGITGVSDSGIVAMRGGGIFTANQKDENGDWIWNTGILPGGINADLITSGRIDTNQIRLFGGQDLRFIWNENGIMAYKPQYGDADSNGLKPITGIDKNAYVQYNGDGLKCIYAKGYQYQEKCPIPEYYLYRTQVRVGYSSYMTNKAEAQAANWSSSLKYNFSKFNNVYLYKYYGKPSYENNATVQYNFINANTMKIYITLNLGDGDKVTTVTIPTSIIESNIDSNNQGIRYGSGEDYNGTVYNTSSQYMTYEFPDFDESYTEYFNTNGAFYYNIYYAYQGSCWIRLGFPFKRTSITRTSTEDIAVAEVSWDGFILRNLRGNVVMQADTYGGFTTSFGTSGAGLSIDPDAGEINITNPLGGINLVGGTISLSTSDNSSSLKLTKDNIELSAGGEDGSTLKLSASEIEMSTAGSVQIYGATSSILKFGDDDNDSKSTIINDDGITCDKVVIDQGEFTSSLKVGGKKVWSANDFTIKLGGSKPSSGNKTIWVQRKAVSGGTTITTITSKEYSNVTKGSRVVGQYADDNMLLATYQLNQGWSYKAVLSAASGTLNSDAETKYKVTLTIPLYNTSTDTKISNVYLRFYKTRSSSGGNANAAVSNEITTLRSGAFTIEPQKERSAVVTVNNLSYAQVNALGIENTSWTFYVKAGNSDFSARVAGQSDYLFIDKSKTISLKIEGTVSSQTEETYTYVFNYIP